ncbi:MAG: bifunctional diguanylate cyclase/phosphodiesterase [Magnetococcales bacterium]|nr:bifunctional diguanylate cyclase/phosphodiesterase [Magnetococcales bacterium]MBF0438785.1 bifunctional diguanylate cyclase/phosphodiesterase [Magnetococcales bacterium]
MSDSNMLGGARLPLQAFMHHLFEEGANQSHLDQRGLIDLLQTTISDILKNEVIESKMVLNATIDVIRLSSSTISLKEKLQLALEIILSVPSVFGLNQGCVFLVDEPNQKLRMVASKNFSDEQIGLCSTVEFGSCLCGRAIACDGPFMFVPERDDDHVFQTSKAMPHGHTLFKVKAMDSDQLLMLVNLFVADQCKEDPRTKFFVESMALALSVLHSLHVTNERLQKFNLEDPLTGLANRRIFQDRLDQAIRKAQRNNESAMVMALGVDRFSRINESMGRAVGDELLTTLATRLSNTLRAGDTVAKADGDEFLLLFSIQNVREIMPPVQRVQNVVAEPITLGGRELKINVSIGISLFPDDQDQLLEKAKFALKNAKEKGGGQYHLFSREAHEKTKFLINLEQDLRTAIDRGELMPYYQPKISLKNMRILGFEALMRWPDPANPSRMLAYPDHFIPLAEETGLILPLGRLVLETACIELKKWLDMGYSDLHIAVNLSARQFADPGLENDIIQVLKKTGLDPHYLELEITESHVMSDAKKARRILESLKSLGVKISLDDFGTGYSSLAHLQDFPFDRLKIDRSFIMNIPTRPTNANIITAILQLAHSLELMVTAEGVETEDQQQSLKEGGCDDVQGWLHSKAVPAAEVPALLERYNRNG